MLLSYWHIRNYAAYHEMTKNPQKCSTLKNITGSRYAKAVCDAMLEKQVEVLKGNTLPLCPKNIMQKNSVFSATHDYTFIHIFIE